MLGWDAVGWVGWSRCWGPIGWGCSSGLEKERQKRGKMMEKRGEREKREERENGF